MRFIEAQCKGLLTGHIGLIKPSKTREQLSP
jgi:hypothetical protein